jgi:hypothetical protein
MLKTSNMVYKTLVVGVIILFIGVCIQPSIAIVQRDKISRDYVDIKIDVCGLPGIKPYTIQLTKEQAIVIENYFDLINEQFEKANTREEAKAILNDVFIKLDEHGLLGGLSIKQAQMLVTGNYENSRVMEVLENLLKKNQRLNDDNSNYLCLVAGRATYISCSGLIQTVLTAFFGAFALLADFFYSILPNAPGWFFILFSILTVLSALNPIPFINPLAIAYSLGFGLRLDYPKVDDLSSGYKTNTNAQFFPSKGFINSYGQNGNIDWIGEFWGQGEYIPSLLNPMWGSSPIGITGFTGLKIMFNPENGDTFFIGSALKVQIGDDFP